MNATRRGRLITLEGADGAGKSTQAARLVDALRARGEQTLLVREPGGTPLGEAVRAILLEDAASRHDPRVDALLFNAARAQLVVEVLRPALGQGTSVVCDRYVDSTLAYQGYGAGLPLEELRWLARWATAGLASDVTILLDLPEEIGLVRRAAGSLSEETRFEHAGRRDLARQRRVREGYLALAAAEPQRWRVVDAAGAPDEVHGAVLAALDAHGTSEPLTAPARITR